MATSLRKTSHNYGSDDAENSGKVLTKSTKLVVAAIDFGTTYSGYAYSFYSEYKRDPLKIYTNDAWSGDGDGLLTMKAPTTILFDKKGKFDSFGFKAESTYANLAENEKHEGWQYFKRFKMQLFEKKNMKKNMRIKDDQGNSKLAFEVFGTAIGYLKDHLMERLKKRIDGILVTDVFWVLTVPAIWDDAAKQFMEESAKKAGIPDTMFTLALEPECAAVYCKELSVFKAKEMNETANLKAFDPGSKFMVIDLGGGTVDITAHEVNSNGTLKELIEPSGGPWGGIFVDEAFDHMIKKMFTDDVVEAFCEECKSDKLDLDRMFETKKRVVSSEQDTIVLKPPSSLISIYDETTGKDFATSLKRGAFATSVNKKRDKFICQTRLFADMFNKPKDALISHLRNLFTRRSLLNVDTLLLVGGFSESEVMRKAISEAMKPRNVILPNEAGLAVVKGAVMYGFNADSISSRKMPFTYGISAAVPFDDKVHPISKKVVRYGIAKCEDIFKVFVEKGREVVPGKTVIENTFNCPYQGAALITIEIYKSTEKQPSYIDDRGANKVGELNLQLTKHSTQVQEIDIQMKFGKTQLEVEAKQSGSLKGGITAAFNFLN